MTRLWRTPPFRAPDRNDYRDEGLTLPPFTLISAVSPKAMCYRIALHIHKNRYIT